jgi:choline-sulfatase
LLNSTIKLKLYQANLQVNSLSNLIEIIGHPSRKTHKGTLLMKKKPNILLIEADQMAVFPLNFYNPQGQAITPNLSALAREGVVFENAYCNSPLCSPSRASKFTGRLPTSHQVWGNGAELPSETPTLMHFLRSSGYRTACSGKCHFVGADQMHGFDRRLTTDMYPSNFDWSIDWDPEVDHRPGTSVQKLSVSGACRTNNQILYDSEVQFRAIEFLRYEALEQPKSPFFLHVSYTQPHDSYQSVPKFLDQYKNIDIEMPRINQECIQNPITDSLAIHHGIDQFPPTTERIRASREAYYAMITHLDEYVGEIVAELKLLGLYEETMIIFTSDHGDMMGERNMWFKRTFWEHSIKVPLVFHQPSQLKPRRVTEVVTLADLCPTLSEIGGAKEASLEWGSTDSASFSKLLKGTTQTWRNSASIQYFGPGIETPWFAIRKGDFKYAYIHGWGGILINLVDDPDEVQNLSETTAQAEILSELHYLLVGQFDLDALTAAVKENKKQRCFLHRTLKGSPGYKWDHQPDFDGSKQYVRGGVNKPVTC